MSVIKAMYEDATTIVMSKWLRWQGLEFQSRSGSGLSPGVHGCLSLGLDGLG